MTTGGLGLSSCKRRISLKRCQLAASGQETSQTASAADRRAKGQVVLKSTFRKSTGVARYASADRAAKQCLTVATTKRSANKSTVATYRFRVLRKSDYLMDLGPVSHVTIVFSSTTIA